MKWSRFGAKRACVETASTKNNLSLFRNPGLESSHISDGPPYWGAAFLCFYTTFPL